MAHSLWTAHDDDTPAQLADLASAAAGVLLAQGWDAYQESGISLTDALELAGRAYADTQGLHFSAGLDMAGQLADRLAGLLVTLGQVHTFPAPSFTSSGQPDAALCRWEMQTGRTQADVTSLLMLAVLQLRQLDAFNIDGQRASLTAVQF